MMLFKRCLFILSFFLIVLNPLLAQTYIADSIRNLLPNAQAGYDELDYRIGMVRAIPIR